MTRRMKISISIVVVSIFVLWHISMPVTRMFTNYYYDKGTSAAVEEVKTLEEREARDQREGQAMQRANFFGRIWDSTSQLARAQCYRMGICWSGDTGRFGFHFCRPSR